MNFVLLLWLLARAAAATEPTSEHRRLAGSTVDLFRPRALSNTTCTAALVTELRDQIAGLRRKLNESESERARLARECECRRPTPKEERTGTLHPEALPVVWQRPMELLLTHIPKAAGASLAYEVEQEVQSMGADDVHTKSREMCYLAAKSERVPGRRFLTMLRNPRTHVVSQYMMLAYKGGWCKTLEPFELTNNTAGLREWLQYYLARDYGGQALGASYRGYRGSCYSPWNMQARMLTCSGKKFPSGLLPFSEDAEQPSLDAARRSIDEQDWVGITELFFEVSDSVSV